MFLEVVAAAFGLAAGLLSGPIPGFHPAPVLVVAMPWSQTRIGACAATAYAVGYLFTSHWATTYLGFPAPDQPLNASPAQRMAERGQGREAVRAAIDGSLAGILLAALLILPLKWIAGDPGRLADLPDWALAIATIALAGWIASFERRKGWRAVVASLVVLAISGAFTVAVLGMHWPPVLGHPVDVRLPLLGGLFAVPALVGLRQGHMPMPAQMPPARRLPWGVRSASAATTLLCTIAGAWSGLLPGTTAGLAATTAHRRHFDARPALAGMAAALSSRQVFALALLWVVGSSRSTLAVAIAPLAPVAWSAGRPPAALALLIAVALAAGILGYAFVRATDRRVANWFAGRRLRTLAPASAAVLVVSVIALAGPLGVVVLVAASGIGLLPGVLGIGRLALSGGLLVPPLMHQLSP